MCDCKAKIIGLAALAFAALLPAAAQTPEDSLYREQNLHEASVSVRRQGQKKLDGAQIGLKLGRTELYRAACCNLGESFSTSAAVDVNYADAATGAKQIRLLGLSGKYVQMLTENLPSYRGAALPYALDCIPGPWMQSIQISKGAASVKNGFEGVAGQINVQLLPPEGNAENLIAVEAHPLAPHGALNAYADTEGRVEGNADARMHFRCGLNGVVLLHYDQRFASHDMNHDTFRDMPETQAYNFGTRWQYAGEHYIFHGGAAILSDERTGGQTKKIPFAERYIQTSDTRRYEGYMKHALLLSHEHESSIALLATASRHELETAYGDRTYDVVHRTLYAGLIWDAKYKKKHELAAGITFLNDRYDETFAFRSTTLLPWLDEVTTESTTGAYGEYTFTPSKAFTLMLGLRGDISSEHDFFCTPRMHIVWRPVEGLSLRGAAGKSYRSPHVLAENHFLLASSRSLTVGKMPQEEAWNFGLTVAYERPVRYGTASISAEYFYTDFQQQLVIDREVPQQILMYALQGRSYSHVWQVDATWPFAKGFIMTAAYRYNLARCTFTNGRHSLPLDSKHKGLLTLSYKTPLGLWQADLTGVVMGGGRMPEPYRTAQGTLSWARTFHAYPRVNAQVTRNFRWGAVYLGGENLTNYRQSHPVLGATNWRDDQSGFDATLIYGPVSGAMGYLGARFNF